jgi:hypothetical protein
MLADRDEAVAAIYAERRTMTPLPELAEATQTQPPPATRAAAARDASPEYKRNQLCWVCEERHICRPDTDRPGRWICRTCEAIT